MTGTVPYFMDAALRVQKADVLREMAIEQDLLKEIESMQIGDGPGHGLRAELEKEAFYRLLFLTNRVVSVEKNLGRFTTAKKDGSRSEWERYLICCPLFMIL